MDRLLEIAEDYRRVKNYVYERYGGIGSLSKLYPGYEIQNEMTGSGLRAELGMPSVYFYLGMFEALGDIKAQWTRTKTRTAKRIAENEDLGPEEKHYLRFLLRADSAFEAALNRRKIRLPGEFQAKYDELSAQVNAEKLNGYLCRLVRKYHVKIRADTALGFAITERAYRYGDHGIYISTKQSRKRIFVPLTDGNQYKCQLYIRLCPKEERLEIFVPINVTVREHPDYINQVGVSMGMFTMFTTQEGHCYGERLGEYHAEYTQWLREQSKSYSRNRENNPGRKKYQAKKNRYVERLHSYINQEINRFLREEKPRVIYVAKLPGAGPGGVNKKINHSAALWQRGYIRSRLAQKCREQAVEIEEVFGRGIGSECSRCGASGVRRDGKFTCPGCGCELPEKVNTARNVFRRGTESGGPQRNGS